MLSDRFRKKEQSSPPDLCVFVLSDLHNLFMGHLAAMEEEGWVKDGAVEKGERETEVGGGGSLAGKGCEERERGRGGELILCIFWTFYYVQLVI